MKNKNLLNSKKNLMTKKAQDQAQKLKQLEYNKDK